MNIIMFTYAGELTKEKVLVVTDEEPDEFLSHYELTIEDVNKFDFTRFIEFVKMISENTDIIKVQNIYQVVGGSEFVSDLYMMKHIYT